MDPDPRGRLPLPAAWRAVRGGRGRARRRLRRPPLLPQPERLRRGIYILPSLFTVANAFCGFAALILAIDKRFVEAALMLFAAIFFDSMDGKIARLTRTTSDFGVELDSLCDVISFGVAPAVLVYTWALMDAGRAGWLVAFIYVVSGASRLARFNVQTAVVASTDFVGLPIPAGAASMATLVFAVGEPPDHPLFPAAVLGLMGAVALLQVSTIRYPSGKHVEWSSRKHYRIIVAIASLMAVVAYHPKGALSVLAILYLLSGPIGKVFFKRGFHDLVADVSPKAVKPAAAPAEPPPQPAEPGRGAA